MLESKALRASMREEAGIGRTVVADSKGKPTEMNDLDHVWVTGFLAQGVLVITPVRR